MIKKLNIVDHLQGIISLLFILICAFQQQHIGLFFASFGFIIFIVDLSCPHLWFLPRLLRNVSKEALRIFENDQSISITEDLERFERIYKIVLASRLEKETKYSQDQITILTNKLTNDLISSIKKEQQ